MSGAPHLFLVVTDRGNGGPVIDDLGTDFAAAMEAFKVAEHEHAGDPAIEVALLGSESIETLKLTHSSYFPDVLEKNTRAIFAKAGF